MEKDHRTRPRIVTDCIPWEKKRKIEAIYVGKATSLPTTTRRANATTIGGIVATATRVTHLEGQKGKAAPLGLAATICSEGEAGREAHIANQVEILIRGEEIDQDPEIEEVVDTTGARRLINAHEVSTANRQNIRK